MKFSVTPRTKIKGNFLSERNPLEDSSVLFVDYPFRKAATMASRDRNESIMTVNFTEFNMLHGTFYKMEKETIHEFVSVSQDFENSLEKETTIVDELVEGASSGDESVEGNEEQVELTNR